MLEIVGAILVIVGVIALIGACLLLFYTGMQLTRAIEIHSDTMSAIIMLREKTKKDLLQIQEWIEITNVQASEAELKTNAKIERMSRLTLELTKELEGVKKSFAELTTTKEEFLN
jgi:hypothetical protein